MEKKLWEVIANQCAPVLADVKPSNLLILTSAEEEVFLQMEELPYIFSLCLYEGKNKSTWLLYRKDRLESSCQKNGQSEHLCVRSGRILFGTIAIYSSNGITAPSYFSLIKFLISSDFRTSTSAFTPSLFSFPSFTTTTFT